MNIKIAVIQFPASNCDLDAMHVLNNVIKVEADLVWHNYFKESNSVSYTHLTLPTILLV